MLSDRIDAITGSQKRTQLILVVGLLSMCLCVGVIATRSGSSTPAPTGTSTLAPVRQVTATVSEVVVTEPPTLTPPPTDTAVPPTVRPTNTARPSATRPPPASATPEPTRTLAPAWTATAAGQATPLPVVPVDTQPPATVPVANTQPPEPTQPPVNVGYTCSGDPCIKGNISNDGRRLYHYPGCPSYNATVIDTSKGERWFSNEAEAQAAGWTKAGNC